MGNEQKMLSKNIFLKHITLILLFLTLPLTLALSAHANSASAPRIEDENVKNKLNTNKVLWTNLQYKASLLFISLKANVSYQTLTSEQANQQLNIDKTTAKEWPVSTLNHQITMQTDLLGTHSAIDLIMNNSGSAIQRTSLMTGRKNYYHQINYLNGIINSIKKRPLKKNEKHLGFKNWTDTSINNFQLNSVQQELLITEAEAIFYIIATSKMSKPGDKYTSYVYDKNGITQLNFVAQDYKSIKTKYYRYVGNTKKRIKGKEKTLRIRLSAMRYISKSDMKSNNKHNKVQQNKKSFSFLGYKGDIDLYVDLDTRVILQLKGKVDYLGSVSIKLKSVTLKNS